MSIHTVLLAKLSRHEGGSLWCVLVYMSNKILTVWLFVLVGW